MPSARLMLWSIWLLFGLLWSLALLTPYPVLLAEALVPVQLMPFSSGLLHVCAYAILAALSGWIGFSWPVRLLLLGLLSGHAFGTEFLQRFVPLRTSSWGHVGLNHFGIVLGLTLTMRFWFARRLQVTHESNENPGVCRKVSQVTRSGLQIQRALPE
jgi:VanZ family protein